MKKIVISALIAAVMVSGVSADEIAEFSKITKDILNPLEMVVGVGYGQINKGVGSASLIAEINNRSVENINNLNVKGEVGVDFTEIEAKAYFSMPLNQTLAIPNVFLGAGYLSIDSSSALVKNNPLDPEATQVGSSKEKGRYAVLGFGQFLPLGEEKLEWNIGYRLGQVEGITSSFGVSKKFGQDLDYLELGLKVSYDQIRHDGGNIDRFAVYGTVTF